ncbi:MAG: CAP domain-containing protein, partial [Proteobacteria bacterium]|nr:CAP domain-containing protein [Pseudomonadota bacterium]
MSPKWKKETVDTTAGVEYLTDSERQVIIEINMVRTNPAEYARSFLVPLRSYYRNKLLRYPGEIAILTNEGIRALDECIKKLQVTKPLSSLSPKKGLTLAARDHARDQARTGAIGHTGSDKSTLVDRLNRYGKWDISAGENIDYGN